MDQNYVKGLMTERNRAWEQAKGILDRCVTDKRERSVEEDQMFERANADIERLGHEINDWQLNERQRIDGDVARSALEGLSPAGEDEARGRAQAVGLADWMRGDERAGNSPYFDLDLKPAANLFRAIRAGADPKEARAIYTDGGASAGSIVVPVGFERQLYQYIEASSAIRRLARVITTDSGNPMTFPRVTTHGVGTQVIAQGTAVGGTDPVFGTMRLDAFRYGQLVKVSTDAVADTGFDLLGFVAENIGRAVGRITDTAYVTGGGSGAPNGVVTAASVAVKTGGTLIALGGGVATLFTGTGDSLIDLQYSVVDEYRNRGVFVMNDATAGTLRKMKDGNLGTIGSYVWTPSSTFDSITGLSTPDRIYGSPVYTDVNFGTNGSAVKPVLFGDLSAYYIRDSGPFRLERSDERYFDTDEIGFRGLLRTDADLIDTGAIKVLQQAV